MSGSTIKTWSAGDILTAADQNAHPVQQQWVVKSGDETITSSTTLQNDDHLFLSVAANTRYLLETFLMAIGSVNVQRIKLFWTAPSGSTLQWSLLSVFGNATSSTDAMECGTLAIGDTGKINAVSSVTPTFSVPRGILLTGGSAGTLQLQWAPDNVTANSATLKSGSMLRLTRLAA